MMFKLLRQTLVQRSEEALCSDAFTGWMDRSEASEFARKSTETTNELYKHVIPEFADWLVCLHRLFRTYYEQDSHVKIASLDIVAEAHRYSLILFWINLVPEGV